MHDAYEDFIASKRRTVRPFGFEASGDLNPNLFDWQRRVVRWALRRGRVALFEECGLGKTIQQLVWAEYVHKQTSRPVVIHTPVGVRTQTRAEAKRFGIGCRVEIVNEPSAIVDGINLVNYEKLHHFDSGVWGGVVLDESSILKSFTGKTKRLLCEAYGRTQYRMACTATPAPNDHMELGNHADFLGVMPSNEMLSRWFINDTMKAGGYRLRGHAKKDFWSWVASWAVCVSKPSDIGGDDTGYDLPPLNVHRHFVEDADLPARPGQLFGDLSVSATTLFEAKRATSRQRAAMTKSIVEASNGPVLIWCDTNDEADQLVGLIECSEVRGSDSESEKERKLSDFSNGRSTRLVTKPSIAGFGMNWQHCRTVIFAGMTFSFESYYQAVRRCWRFGQLSPVDVHIVQARCDESIQSAISRKESDHLLMQTGMSEAMREASLEELAVERKREVYSESKPTKLPSWLGGKA